MDIERYKWPVIIAASLHGALFLEFSNDTLIARSKGADDTAAWSPPVTPPPEIIEWNAPEETSGGDATSPVEALPRQIEIPPVNTLSDFTVPPLPPSPPAAPVARFADPLPPGSWGPGGEGPFRTGIPSIPRGVDLDRPPRTMAQPAPDYPHGLRQGGVSGSVTVEFVVGTDGRVITADAMKWSHREFVDPAVRAVYRWRFEPGTMNGKKVRFRMAVPIEFNAGA